MSPDPLIRARDLARTYGSGPSAVTALSNVSFEIPAGQRTAILGKSGSGKSTMLNLLGGLDRPSGGSLVVNGQDLATLTRSQMADYRLRSIGFVFQSFHLIPSQSIVQNVELPLTLAGVSPRERRKQAEAALDAVGLSGRLSHRPADLSGGERQRAAIARAMINRPAILLADEPTGNLDSTNATAVMELIQLQIRERGMTLILVTHDEELANRTTDRILRMTDGRIGGDTSIPNLPHP